MRYSHNSTYMNIEEIKKKIQIILELPQLKPFGGIYMNPVLEEAKVAKIEKENRITFPADYRTFITQIANGCVGPDYGLRSLKEATEDLMWKDRTIDLSTPFPYSEPWNEEEWLNSIDWDGGERPTQEQLEAYMDTKRISGCLQICHIGHGASYLLVVNGKEKGYIWLDSRQDYGGLSPEFNEKGEKLTFEMWYTDWLNKVVAPEKVWFEKSLQLIKKAFPKIEETDFRLMIYVLHKHYSGMNLATLIAQLYGLNPMDIYFGKEKFIQRENYDEQTIEQYEARLRESGFYDWAAEEE